jgi:hypothetical protein
MKSKILLSLTFSMMVMGAIAQKDNVGIGTTKPDQSAALEISSSNKGLLTPRMSLQQRNSIQNPATGLIVYQTDLLSGFYFYDGKEWKSMASETGAKSIADATNWGLTGNSGTTAGTNFIGTTDNVPLVIKVNGKRAGYIPDGNSLYLGVNSGLNATGVENFGLGPDAVSQNTGGFNTAVGFGALKSNVAGQRNIAIGRQSMQNAVGGSDNIVIGSLAMIVSSSASNNIAIGSDALAFNSFESNPGGNNVAIGFNAGKFSYGGVGNIFLGYQAGLNGNESNKLYISNSSTENPLIKGDFSNQTLKINVGATSSASAGFLAVGDFGAVSPMNSVGGYRLIVQDGILTEKIKVAVKNTADWADYVFEKDYKLLPLEKVEEYLKENKHLPNVPSAQVISNEGLDLMKTSAKLMEKVEELTLYLIEMNKELNKLKNENLKLNKRIK